MSKGRIHLQDEVPESGVPFEEILRKRKLAALYGQAKTTSDPKEKKYSMHSFGAHFLRSDL